MLTTVTTKMVIPAHHATLGCTPKQIAWLKYAVKEYGIEINFNFANRVEASTEISRIQNLINKGLLTKSVTPEPVIPHVWYAVIEKDGFVAIKTFGGSLVEAKAKSYSIYGKCVKNVLDSVDDAKSLATELRNNLIVAEVAITTTDAELTMDALNALSVEDLRQLATDMGVDLGRSKKRETIIARILA